MIFYSLQPLILASASPRRRDLLESVGLTFEVMPSGADEVVLPNESHGQAARRWSREKATAVSGRHPHSWVLAADTIVVLNNVIYGKPQSLAEAVSMLTRLGGKTHRVISGICLMHQDLNILMTDAVETSVQFKTLAQDEIMAYVGTGEPFDKAGAYGIQGMGAFLVRSIRGSYTNVVGLPLSEVLQWLLEHRVIAPVSGARA